MHDLQDVDVAVRSLGATSLAPVQQDGEVRPAHGGASARDDIRMRQSPFIPEGAGPCQASDLGKFVVLSAGFPGRCRQAPARGRGQGSTGGRPVGRGLDAGSEWRRLCVPGIRLWGWRVLQCPDVGTVSEAGSRSLFIPSPPARGGMEWYAAARRGQSRQVDHATVGGGQNGLDLAYWLRRVGTHAGRARQRMCPSRSP